MPVHAPLAEKAAPRVAVGHAHDPEEREADRLAQMLVAPVKRGCSACSSGAAPCPACAAGAAKLRRSALAPGPATAPARLLRGAGTPLPAATRDKFERRLGADLSAIRLHQGAEAASASAAVGARAFALGRDIALGARAPSPATPEGERLLAHEVAHTVQAGAATTLRRQTDFTVRGLSPNAAGDASTIYFEYNSAALQPTERAKIAPLATPAGQALTLFGYASEEGSAASRTGLTNRRIAAVASALRGAGHTARHTPSPDISRGEGNIDYRSMRSVAVVPTPTGIGAGPAVSPLGSGTCTMAIPCGTSLTTAHPVATSMLSAAKTAVDTPTPAATTQLGTLFPGIPRADIQTALNGLVTEVARMTAAANHRCHDYPCDSMCDRPGYASPASRVMTLCPSFVNGSNVTENAVLLLHEGLHMVPGLTTEDFAYRSSRFIDFIPSAQARTNTDSFVLLIIRLSGSSASGPLADPVGGLAAADQLPARRAIAFAEQWLLMADWDSKQLYEAIKIEKTSVGGWTAAHHYQAGTQHAIAATFGLTDPGPAPFATVPTQADQEKVAGLNDRYRRMMYALWVTPITVTSGAADAWAPNLGNAATLSPAFFALTAPGQVLRLIELMAGSLPTSDVPAGRRRDYATGAQQIWLHAGRTGP